jgi:hypothetical protein
MIPEMIGMVTSAAIVLRIRAAVKAAENRLISEGDIFPAWLMYDDFVRGRYFNVQVKTHGRMRNVK